MIRVGLVGFGMAGRVFHAPLISSVEGLELAAVVERNSDNAAERYPGITTYRSVEELLADASIKLVVVATPNSSHFSIAMQALEAAARNVVVDKPMALSSDEIRQLSELAGGIGLQLFPFHNRRFDNDFQTVRKVIDDRLLGRLVHVESTFDRWRPGQSTRAWKEESEQGGILLISERILWTKCWFFLVNLRRWELKFGGNVMAMARIDSITIRLHYLTGFSVTLGANSLSSLARPRFHLRGTRGNFWKWGSRPQEDELGKITRIGEGDWGNEASERWGTLSIDVDSGVATKPVPSEIGDYRRFYAAVRDSFAGKPEKDLATATDAWRTARILEWAKQSSDEHRDIECDWSGEPV